MPQQKNKLRITSYWTKNRSWKSESSTLRFVEFNLGNGTETAPCGRHLKIWVFLSFGGTPISGWFISWNIPIYKWMTKGNPISENLHIWKHETSLGKLNLVGLDGPRRLSHARGLCQCRLPSDWSNFEKPQQLDDSLHGNLFLESWNLVIHNQDQSSGYMYIYIYIEWYRTSFWNKYVSFQVCFHPFLPPKRSGPLAPTAGEHLKH